MVSMWVVWFDIVCFFGVVRVEICVGKVLGVSVVGVIGVIMGN